MRDGLGDDTEYHQPRRLREQIHLGRLNIKQTEGHTLPVKQHHEYQLAVKIVKEREQQRIASRNFGQEEVCETCFVGTLNKDAWWREDKLR